MADQIQNVNCGFFDAVNSDRVYSADDMNKPYKRLVSDGVFASPDGTPSTDLQVHQTNPSSMSIVVDAGEAMVAHKWFKSQTQITFNVPTNTGLTTRYDSVIIQVDERITGRVGNVIYRTGDSSVPALSTDAGVTEYRVANITVPSGTSAITNSRITDLRGSSDCPWVAALIEQPDLSQLWQNFYDAYSASLGTFEAEQRQYETEQRQAWEDFLDSLTSELSVTMNVTTLKSTYTASGTVTTIPINISGYSSSTDILLVFINGLLASPSMYSQSGSNIILTNSISAGNKVDFLVLKSVVSGDISSTTSLIQELQSAMTEYMSDSGWTDLTLNSGIVPYPSDALKPMIRNVGGRVYIRGMCRNVSAGLIGSVPSSCVPDYLHRYGAIYFKNSTNVYSGMCVVTINNGGAILIQSPSQAFDATDWLVLDTCYLAAEVPTAVFTSVPDGDDVNY